MAALSSTFYRLERKVSPRIMQVVEFHTVVNGNLYCEELEEWINEDGTTSWKTTTRHCVKTNKEAGNKYYKSLLNYGFRFAGKFTEDVFGHKEALR